MAFDPSVFDPVAFDPAAPSVSDPVGFTGIEGRAWSGKLALGHHGDDIAYAPDATVFLSGSSTGRAITSGTLRVVEDILLNGEAFGTAAPQGIEPIGHLTVVDTLHNGEPITPVTAVFRLDGTEITDVVELKECEFVASARGTPGTATLRIRNPSGEYRQGMELTCDLGGRRLWGGFVMAVRHGFYFPAAVETRYVVLQAVDYNILTERRILYDKTDPTNLELTSFPPGTPDRDVIRHYAANHTDLPGDNIDIGTGIEHVGTPTLDGEIAGHASWRFNEFLTHIRYNTGAIDYIDPERRLVHTDVDTPNAPFGISDQPIAGEIGARELEIDFGAESMRNDALMWGIGQGPSVVADGVVDPSAPYTELVDSWINRVDVTTLNGNSFTNAQVSLDGPGGNSCIEATGFHQQLLMLTGLTPGMRVTVTCKTHGRLSGGGTGVTLYAADSSESSGYLDSQQQSWEERSASVIIGSAGTLGLYGVWGPVIADLVITQAPETEIDPTYSVEAGAVFARTDDEASIAEHGLWQVGRMIPNVWKQATIERIADSYVYGSPQNRRGGKDDRVAVRCTVHVPGLRVADKVNVRSVVYDFEDVLPIREMRLTWPTAGQPRFDLTLSHEIDDPWLTAEYWFPNFAWHPPDLGDIELPPLIPPPPIRLPPGPEWVDAEGDIILIGHRPPRCINGVFSYIADDPENEFLVTVGMSVMAGTTPPGLPLPDHPSGFGYYLIDGSASGLVGYRWQNADAIIWQSQEPLIVSGASITQGIGGDQRNICGRIAFYVQHSPGGPWEYAGDSGPNIPPQTAGGEQVLSATLNGVGIYGVMAACAEPSYRYPGVFNVAGNWIVNEARLMANCIATSEPNKAGFIIGGTGYFTDPPAVFELEEPPDSEPPDSDYVYYSVSNSWIPGSLMVWVDGLLQNPATYTVNSIERWIRFAPGFTGDVYIRYLPLLG